MFEMNLLNLHPIEIQDMFNTGKISVEEYGNYFQDVEEGLYDTIKPRFIEEGDEIIFPKNKSRHHISFVKTYTGLTIPQARRKMKTLWAWRSLQNDMIHYLKCKNLLKI